MFVLIFLGAQGCSGESQAPDGAVLDAEDAGASDAYDAHDAYDAYDAIDAYDAHDAGDGDTSEGDPGDHDADGGDSGPVSDVDCENIYQTPGGQTSFYESNPTYEDPEDDTASWTFSTPGDQGMDADLLADAVAELDQLPYMWSFLVIRNDAIVLERYFNGSQATDSNNVHSASKSILSALVGIAIEQGYIEDVDQRVCEILPEHFAGIQDAAKENITVRHLLTMSAGFEWEEDATEYQIERQEDWVQAILELPLADQPGERFNYCTGQSHVLSAVITEATGMSTCEFAHLHLLGHLGITAEHWGRDPQMYFSGGCNLYLTPRELARFGLLYLHGGSWNEAPIVTRQWVEESTTSHMSAGWGYGYGYYWWLYQIDGHEIFIAWGWGGQLVYLIPDLNIVVVFTTNTKDYSEDFDGEQIISQYVIPSITK